MDLLLGRGSLQRVRSLASLGEKGSRDGALSVYDFQITKGYAVAEDAAYL
jgi:hypothetical protein